MTDKALRTLDALPVFPDRPAPAIATGGLRVVGLVDRPLDLRWDELRALADTELVADFACEEGWNVAGLRWRGVPIRRLLDLAGVDPAARFLGVGSGGYLAVLPLPAVGSIDPLLVFELNGAPLPSEHGGPARLVSAGAVCYQSVKWVDRLELLASASADTATAIARTRLETP